MESFGTVGHGTEAVAYREVVVVVGMKVEMLFGVAFHNFLEVAGGLFRSQHAEGVRQHETSYAALAQRLNHLENVFRIVTHSVTPVFEVEIDGQSLVVCQGNVCLNIGNMFFGCLVQLVGAVFLRTLGEHIDDLGAALCYPID